MKIIFLDIDGVLNSYTDFVEVKKYGHPINKGNEIISSGKLALLQTIIEQTSAVIVLSSSWREMYHLDQIHEMFVKRGWTLDREVLIDETPCHRRGFSDDGYKYRGGEVQEWLDKHPDVEKFVIVDDRDEFKDHQQEFFVKTEWVNGLNGTLASKVVEILGKNEEALEEERKREASIKLLMGYWC